MCVLHFIADSEGELPQKKSSFVTRPGNALWDFFWENPVISESCEYVLCKGYKKAESPRLFLQSG